MISDMPLGNQRIAHVILTRFNLATPGRESSIRNQPGWLDHRFGLFERFCLPSVTAQTTRDFVWLIFFDNETPQLYRDRIERCRAVFPFVPVFTPMFKMEGWAQAVRAHVEPRVWLATTRLDNDDGLAVDYCERLRRSITRPRPHALNFTDGFILADRKIYAHRHLSNAFASYLEPFNDKARTICSIEHMKLASQVELVQIEGPGAWLQVIHDRNVSNKIRGFRISAEAVRSRFPPEMTRDLSNDWIARKFENAVLLPLRWTRDLTIDAIKNAFRR